MLLPPHSTVAVVARAPVLAEAAAATLLALAALPPVLAEKLLPLLLAVAVVALPPVLAEAAAAAAFLALAAQPPVLAAAAYLTPHWPQIIRARVPRTANEPSASLVPIDERADSRSQIPREKFGLWRKKDGRQALRKKKVKNLLNKFLFLLRILSLRFCRFLCSGGDHKSRRSHPTCAPLVRKQKSVAAIGIWRVSDHAKEIPFLSETRI